MVVVVLAGRTWILCLYDVMNMIRFIPGFLLKFNGVAFLMELFLEKRRVRFVAYYQGA